MAWRFHAIDAALSPWNLTHWLMSTQATRNRIEDDIRALRWLARTASRLAPRTCEVLERKRVLACVEIKFRTPDAIDAILSP